MLFKAMTIYIYVCMASMDVSWKTLQNQLFNLFAFNLEAGLMDTLLLSTTDTAG